MANSYKLYHLQAVLFTFLILSQSSFARLLNEDYLPKGLAARTKPALNLALPGDNNSVSSDKESTSVLPCDHMDSNKNFDMRISASPKLAGKYGPMVLNILPKGTITPSGPSKGTNSLKN